MNEGLMLFLLVAWFVVDLILGRTGFLSDGPVVGPLRLAAAIAIPETVLLTLYYRRRGVLWDFLDSLYARVLILPHATRIIGALFLLDYARGRLPAGFALPAG